VQLAGLTLKEARKAIEDHLTQEGLKRIRPNGTPPRRFPRSASVRSAIEAVGKVAIASPFNAASSHPASQSTTPDGPCSTKLA
jgi:hypothetical protein